MARFCAVIPSVPAQFNPAPPDFCRGGIDRGIGCILRLPSKQDVCMSYLSRGNPNISLSQARTLGRGVAAGSHLKRVS